jgi:hypothetical protein
MGRADGGVPIIACLRRKKRAMRRNGFTMAQPWQFRIRLTSGQSAAVEHEARQASGECWVLPVNL